MGGSWVPRFSRLVRNPSSSAGLQSRRTAGMSAQKRQDQRQRRLESKSGALNLSSFLRVFDNFRSQRDRWRMPSPLHKPSLRCRLHPSSKPLRLPRWRQNKSETGRPVSSQEGKRLPGNAPPAQRQYDHPPALPARASPFTDSISGARIKMPRNGLCEGSTRESAATYRFVSKLGTCGPKAFRATAMFVRLSKG